MLTPLLFNRVVVSTERGLKPKGAKACWCTDKLEKPLTALRYWVIKRQMKSSMKESNTHKENLKYAHYTVVSGCFSGERLWCDCGLISWNIPAVSSGMDSEQSIPSHLERRRAKPPASVNSLSPWWVQVSQWNSVRDSGHPVSKGIE